MHKQFECITDHNRPQHGHEAAKATPLLHQRPPHRLLLRLLQQQVLIADVLHGAVQLGLQVSTAWTQTRAHTSLHPISTRNSKQTLTALTNQLENSHFSLVTSCQPVSRPVNGCKSYRTKSLCLVWIGPALFQSLCPSLKHILVYSGGWAQGKTCCGNQAMKKRRNSKHSGKMLPSADESFSHRKYL